FKKSSKRQVGLERMQDFCGIVHHKLLKPSDTRWLAMQQISSRLAEQWDALKAYFNSLPVDHELNEEGQKSRKLDKYTKEKLCKIKSALNNDRNRLCYLFLKQYLLKFTCFNQFFQTTRPVAYLTISKLQSLYKDILNCFIHPSIVNQSKANLLGIDTTDPDNIMDRDSIWYGDSQVFDICGELEDNGQIDIVKEFQSIVLDSYQRSIQQMQTLPFDDELIRDIQCLDPAKQGKESVRPAFTKLARHFPDVIPKGELGKLDAELRTYDTYDLPADTDRDDVAKFWVTVGSITDSVQKTFPILFKLSRALLIIPHGNAESEQLFSRLSLLKTKFKSHMTGETLNSVLAINFNNQDECYNFKPSRSVIENARRATTAQNQRQKTHADSDQESDFEEVTVVECRPTRQRKSKRNFDFVYE
ncbi:MAG: hAT transposon family protein, partial [Sedimenticola sp.]